MNKKIYINRRALTVIYLFTTLLLIGVIWFCVCGTVHSMEKRGNDKPQGYYHEIEGKFISGLRGELTERGYRNAGITLNRFTDADGEVSYIARIHHDGIHTLCTAEIDSLSDELPSELSGYEVRYNFWG